MIVFNGSTDELISALDAMPSFWDSEECKNALLVYTVVRSLLCLVGQP